MDFLEWYTTEMSARMQHADMIVTVAIIAIFAVVMYRVSFR